MRSAAAPSGSSPTTGVGAPVAVRPDARRLAGRRGDASRYISSFAPTALGIPAPGQSVRSQRPALTGKQNGRGNGWRTSVCVETGRRPASIRFSPQRSGAPLDAAAVEPDGSSAGVTGQALRLMGKHGVVRGGKRRRRKGKRKIRKRGVYSSMNDNETLFSRDDVAPKSTFRWSTLPQSSRAAGSTRDVA